MNSLMQNKPYLEAFVLIEVSTFPSQHPHTTIVVRYMNGESLNSISADTARRNLSLTYHFTISLSKSVTTQTVISPRLMNSHQLMQLNVAPTMHPSFLGILQATMKDPYQICQQTALAFDFAFLPYSQPGICSQLNVSDPTGA